MYKNENKKDENAKSRIVATENGFTIKNYTFNEEISFPLFSQNVNYRDLKFKIIYQDSLIETSCDWVMFYII